VSLTPTVPNHSDRAGALLALMAELEAAPATEVSHRATAVLQELTGAELVIVLAGGEVVATSGGHVSAQLGRDLRDAAAHGRDRAALPGGEATLAAAPLYGRTGWLLIARHGAPFASDVGELITGAAKLLDLHHRLALTAEAEALQRRRGERELRDRQRAERELAHQSLHDALTGLPNRILLRERAVHALHHAHHGRPGHIAILLVDIDHFKLANDALDHRRGDRLLDAAAQRLSHVLAPEDPHRHDCTLARPGGDEFIVLCEGVATERDAVTIAQQIQDALRAPFFIDGRSAQLTASVGIAVAPLRADGVDADRLLRDADVALSRAKERGRDRYEIFDTPMRARLLDRVALESDLRLALDTGQLRLHYQPVVTVSEGTLSAVEALVRWQHPERGLLGPGEFIPVAEESELIVSLGAWVIEEACAQIRRWRDADPARLGVRVSVNVSARQLSPGLIETVAAALEEHGVGPASLALEITESLLIEHTESAREVLAGLEQLGVAIVLDDFGTGYSSLRYLSSFHVSQLKLDRSFTVDLAREARPAKIIAATIDMARALGMTIVAEGVETFEQVEVLRRLGCDYAQGFYYARPEPPGAMLERMRAAYEEDRAIAARPSAEAAPAPNTSSDADSLHRRQQVAIGRLAGWMFLGGSAICLPAGLVLRAPNLLTAILLCVMGAASGVVCLRLPWERVSESVLVVFGVLGTVEITITVISVGPRGMVLEPIYLLILTAAAYAFRDRRVIALHVALIAVAMATVLLVRDQLSGSAVALTIVLILTLAGMSALIAYLRELLEGSAAELREMAASDPLTGVGNYRRLHERLEYELVRHRRDDSTLSLLLIDLDRFKQVNERRGHAAGDDVLRRVATTLREAVRSQDTVARQGGDEFAVLAPDTDAEGAAMLAARIRDRLSRVQFAGDAIGATVGWSVYPADGRSAAELLARADEVLMTGKLAPAPDAGQTAGPAAAALPHSA
jgi:diguanylate cyclase (GGDEF)-like protein